MDLVTVIVGGAAAIGLLVYLALLAVRVGNARRELDEAMARSRRPAEDADVEEFRALLEPECEGDVPVELALEWINSRRLFDEWAYAAAAVPAPEAGRLDRRAHAVASRSRTVRAREELGRQLLGLYGSAGYEKMLGEVGLDRDKARELVREARRP
jgi:hypothetical protein